MEATGPRASHILLLLSDTGGGHRSVAEALAEAFGRQAPAARVTLLDLLHDHTRFPINRAGRIYRFMVQRAPVLWRLTLWAGEDVQRLSWMMRLSMPLVAAARRGLRDQAADLVISVHPLLNHIPLRFLREVGSPAPFVTMVTDWITAPPAWFCPQVNLCIVPSEAAARRASAGGLSRGQVRVVGMPVSSRFAPLQPGEKRRSRQRLGLDPLQPTALLVGGGSGVGSLERIAISLAEALALRGYGQLAVICGRNEHLQARLAGRRWRIPVTVRGFVSDMPDWMGAADLILTKAGPSTIAEALVVGLPIVLYGFIAGQEEGNVPYVVEGGAGVYIEEPEALAHQAAEWLRPGHLALAEMAARARALGRPSAADEVVTEVVRLLPIR